MFGVGKKGGSREEGVEICFYFRFLYTSLFTSAELFPLEKDSGAERFMALVTYCPLLSKKVVQISKAASREEHTSFATTLPALDVMNCFHFYFRCQNASSNGYYLFTSKGSFFHVCICYSSLISKTQYLGIKRKSRFSR